LLRAGLMLTATALIVSGCGERTEVGALAERGRQIYLTQCATCHGADPAQAGPLGPPVKGSSRDLLEAKILRGAYPPGYQPKRPTAVMPPQPGLAADIAALAEYLK
jgi:mono/diheme cytochrome c family protein